MEKQSYTTNACRDFAAAHDEIRGRIEERIRVFRATWARGSEADIFIELAFCLLTPQTKARQGEKAVNLLLEKNLMFSGTAAELGRHLNIVRFRYRKAEYLVRAREQFSRDGAIMLKKILKGLGEPLAMREYLAREVKGFGMKEASHFLRNIGLGEKLAILDRHILKNLCLAGCIGEIPTSITPARYLDIETRMVEFAGTLDIPMEHLDFVLWYMETGDIYK